MSTSKVEAPKVSDAVEQKVAAFHRAIVEEVAAAVGRDPIVVVGMAQNPFVKRARKALTAAGLTFTYLEYGSYLSKWKQRLAIKLWAQFPTFPMVFVNGELRGGAMEVEELIAKGELKA